MSKSVEEARLHTEQGGHVANCVCHDFQQGPVQDSKTCWSRVVACSLPPEKHPFTDPRCVPGLQRNEQEKLMHNEPMTQAVGMMATLKPTMIMRPDDPIGMMQEVIAYLKKRDELMKAKLLHQVQRNHDYNPEGCSACQQARAEVTSLSSSPPIYPPSTTKGVKS